MIAWGRYDGAQYVAQAVIRNADGTLGSIRTLATSDQPLGGPKAGIDADGNALLAWTRWDGTDFRVQARTLPPVGPLGLTQSLSNAGQDASAPELAVNQDGHGVIAWTRSDGNDYRVEGRTMATTNIVGVGDPSSSRTTSRTPARRTSGSTETATPCSSGSATTRRTI